MRNPGKSPRERPITDINPHFSLPKVLSRLFNIPDIPEINGGLEAQGGLCA